MDTRKPNQIDDRLIALELTMLHHHEPASLWDGDLSLETVKQSPYLLREYALRQYRAGQLTQAEQALAETVRMSAGMNLRQVFLSSMACLTRLKLRTGDLANAEIGLRFLAEECDHADRLEASDEEMPGEVYWTLAAGSRLLEGNRNKEKEYARAVNRFALNGDGMQMLRVMLERLFDEETGPIGLREAHEWNLRIERTAISLQRREASLANLAKIMILVRSHDRDPKQSDWRKLPDAVSEYPFEPLLEIAFLRGQPAPDPRSALQQIDSLLSRHAVDLELRRALLTLKLQLLADEPDQREIPSVHAELQAVCSLLRMPFPPGIANPPHLQAKGSDPEEAVPNARPPAPTDKDGTPPAAIKRRIPHPSGGIQDQPRVTIQCFHGLKWLRNGQELPPAKWRRKKSRELLVYLIMQPSYGAVREQILDALFAHCSPAQGNNQLNVAVHALKQWLEEQLGIRQMLVTENGLVRLREETIEYTDVEQYQELVRIGDQLWQEDRELSVELYSKAVAMYGPLLPEMPYADWLQLRRSAAETSQARILYRLAEEARSRQSYDEAEAWALEWVRLFPQQEEAYQMVLKVMLETGRRREARAWYLKLEHMCRTELETAPTDESVRMMGGL